MIESAVGLDAIGRLSDQRQNRARRARSAGSDRASAFRRRKAIADAPLQALIFDSWFDPYRGVIILVRVIDGDSAQGTEDPAVVERPRVSRWKRLGVLTPKPVEVERTCRRAKSASSSPTSRTLPTRRSATPSPTTTNPAIEPLPGFEEIKPMVFAGLYPVDSHEHTLLRDALEKLRLNDSSFIFEPESSVALGFGFRCGFLGLLHMEIMQERLEREFDLDLITTAPGVRYRITMTDGELIEVDNPSRWPDPSEIAKIEEPIITRR